MTLFNLSAKPRVFAVPPGQNFAAEFVAGYRRRLAGKPPETAARTSVILSAERLRQGIRYEFAKGPPGLLPDLRLVTDFADDPIFPDIPPYADELRTRLKLWQKAEIILKDDARFCSRMAAYDVVDSLMSLLDEMYAEGVCPERIKQLELPMRSAHWKKILTFIDIREQCRDAEVPPGRDARQRLVIERLAETWKTSPPEHPVIVAGSTGSRGPSQLLMTAAARLPQGAVVLPCFDFEMPQAIWDSLADSETGEEHPQYRLSCIMNKFGLKHSDIAAWNAGSVLGNPRHRLISLALRPAPVTDQWMTEGPKLSGLHEAAAGLTLIEAPGPRQEAVAIALRLREAVEDGETALLATPDQRLARQVTAALRRWSISLENSFSDRLLHTMYGRLLHSVADMLGKSPDPTALMALLKHPMTHAARDRELHGQMTAWLELKVRARKAENDIESVIDSMRSKQEPDSAENAWIAWLKDCLNCASSASESSLLEFAARHEDLVAKLAAGSQTGDGTETLPAPSSADEAAARLFQAMRNASDAGGPMACMDYAHLFKSLAARENVREACGTHPLVSILNTVDARMRAPDLVIAGGLNEGTWPKKAQPDPWLNRNLRREAGLLLPERLSGLLAHDFQQAACVGKTVLSRCTRDIDSPTVPARWLSRLVSLLAGLDGNSRQALAEMRRRGDEVLQRARIMEEPRQRLEPETRPQPKPPRRVRPGKLSVTAIRTLITNPYEIYAKHILRLWELTPLSGGAEILHRGMTVHRILRLFIDETKEDSSRCSPERLRDLAAEQFDASALPPYAKRFWQAQLDFIAENFIKQEMIRREHGDPAHLLGSTGQHRFPDLRFILTARVDRIDRAENGWVLYDYKTGTIPTARHIEQFDKQIPLTAVMIEKGAFGKKTAGSVLRAAYIGVGNRAKEVEIQRHRKDTEDIFAKEWSQLQTMLRNYLDENTPYIARRDVRLADYGRAYHHLARFGEWDDTAELRRDDGNE